MSKAKVVLAVLAMLSLASGSQAGPIKWLRRHKEFTVALAALAAGTTIEQKGVTRCQQGYLEVCNEGYGARRGFAVFAAVGSLALIGAGEACKKDQPGWWFCHGLEFSGPVTQTAFGFYDFKRYKPCDPGEAACGDSTSKFRVKK